MCDLADADKTNLSGDNSFVNSYVQKLINQNGKKGCSDQEKDDGIMDSYISGLQHKYLKNDKGDCSSNKKCENSMDLIRGVLSCSPSSMLNESERNHYTRAMEELRVLLDLSQKKLAESKLDSVQSKIAGMDPSKKGDLKEDQCTVVEEVSDDTLTQSITLPTGLQSTLTTTNTTSNQNDSKTKKSVRISLESNDYCDLMRGENNEEDVDDDGSMTEASTANEEEMTVPAPKMEEADARAIHQELMTIHAKLNVKSQNLNEAYGKMAEREEGLIAREAELVEREQMVEDRERREGEEKMNEAVVKNMISKLNEVEADVRRKMKSMQMNHSEEIASMRESAEEKKREMKRMKNSFDALKQQNDELRFDSKSLREENERVRSQNLKLRKRLENLQRKMEFDSRKKSNNNNNNVLLEAAPSCTSIQSDGGNESETKHSTSASVTKTSLSDKKLATRCVTALSVSLEWICQVHLKPSTLKQQQVANSLYASEEYLTDRCLKLLPLMVEVFRHIPLTSITIVRQQLTFLRFVYWSLLHLDEVNQTVLATTSRRIGEELVRSGRCEGQDKSLLLMTGLDATSSSSSASGSNKPCYKHSNVELRMLSCFVILRTLNQADVLAKVIEQLRRDLKSEENRALFIDYQATKHVLVPYLTHKSNKTLTTMVVDIMLQLSMESSVMDDFLSQCSNEKWFKSIATTLHSLNHNPRNTDQVVLEKLIVILQKLSKVKSNRKFFDSFALSSMIQDKFRACPIQEHQFLHVNLRSILSNLNMIKPNSSSTT